MYHPSIMLWVLKHSLIYVLGTQMYHLSTASHSTVSIESDYRSRGCELSSRVEPEDILCLAEARHNTVPLVSLELAILQSQVYH